MQMRKRLRCYEFRFTTRQECERRHPKREGRACKPVRAGAEGAIVGVHSPARHFHGRDPVVAAERAALRAVAEAYGESALVGAGDDDLRLREWQGQPTGHLAKFWARAVKFRPHCRSIRDRSAISYNRWLSFV